MPMRDDIVEVESPETGTPLPDSYQAAPPLSRDPHTWPAASRPARPTLAPAMGMVGALGSRRRPGG
jgi:hypothetical protein